MIRVTKLMLGSLAQFLGVTYLEELVKVQRVPDRRVLLADHAVVLG